MSDMTKAPPPAGARRMAPKIDPSVYESWPNPVADSGGYEYKQAPSGADVYVITKAPQDKAHLVGMSLSPEVVKGSPRLTASLAAIQKTVAAAKGPVELPMGIRVADAKENTRDASAMESTPGMLEIMTRPKNPRVTYTDMDEDSVAESPPKQPAKKAPFSGARAILNRAGRSENK